MYVPLVVMNNGNMADMACAAAAMWNLLMAPKGFAGSLLLSPSMCKQMAEDGWLAQFQKEITRDFDILNLHINKNSMEGVKASIDYYYNRYKKPIWVTEVSQWVSQRYIAGRVWADGMLSLPALTTSTASTLARTRARSTSSSRTLSTSSRPTPGSTRTPTRTA